MRLQSEDEGVTDQELRLADRLHAEMPRCLEECPGEDEQCPFVACRYHLWTDVVRLTVTSGKGHKRASHRWELQQTDAWGSWPTCALRAANQGPRTLDEVGEILGVTRERVRQIQAVAIGHLAEIVSARELCDPSEIERGMDWDEIFATIGEWSI